MMRIHAGLNRFLVLAVASVACSLSLLAVAPSTTETAAANGDTRTIHFYHTHTGESIDATFRVDGHYDQAVLNKLNYFLRDWRNNDQTVMDPRLFDTLWEVYREAGAGETPIQIYSAYRSPETNAMLRRRSRAVAEHSQHMLGKAMDTTMPGMPMEKIREIGMKLQRGGVGYYQSANFVHLDVGGVRSWPRMSYDQLARLFPDGKTVHIPSNGVPMPRYEEARAEIASRGGVEVPPAQQSQGFFAWLFGGSGEHDGAAPAAVAANAPAPSVYANNTEGDESSVDRGPTAGAKMQALAMSARSQPETSVQPVAVAAAEPAAIDAALPLPPRRPAALLASADDVLPLPPVRSNPQSGFRLASIEDDAVPTPLPRPAVVPDAIGGLIGAANAGTPAPARNVVLPEIITRGTQGTEAQLPTRVLAFAAPESTASVRSSDLQGGSHAAPSPKALGLRGVATLRGDLRGNKRAGGIVAAPASTEAASLLSGPAIYGLRRAALGSGTAASL
jgi:uncharacterized protein YcbK (DUF882 family)